MAACKLLSRANAKHFLESVDCFLLDCDGVLWNDSLAIEGACQTVQKLKEMGKRVFYVTNNSTKTRADYFKKCEKLGFPAKQEDVVCTAYVMAAYLKNVLKFKDKVYLLGSAAMATEFDNNGIRYTGLGPDPVGDDEFYEDWMKITLDPEVKCVCVGFDKHISYRKIVNASSYITKRKCMFLATNEDGFLPTSGDICIAGTGSMVAPVKVATGVDPIVVGKPCRPIFDVVKAVFDVNPLRTVMVGDRLNTDIALGHNCGLQSLFVLTGAHSLDDVKQCKEPIGDEPTYDNCVPDYYIPSFGDLGQYID